MRPMTSVKSSAKLRRWYAAWLVQGEGVFRNLDKSWHQNVEWRTLKLTQSLKPAQLLWMIEKVQAMASRKFFE